ncbi:DUF6531 domain-containing protein [Amycolatopsis sp. OK19-0408]|uniref:DUF6531 domain-containing protein n=1 Tax=Amycolatopsis iheyensis TaxID=2945988 RepID=A0A9X2NHA8_9PSEU|nr:DUF6531 domain-containing protein [Amycolatopsis iheyensis]MCR6488729.1 DUF6531 domain-containing protein [Amycolatopsis iheyensis]
MVDINDLVDVTSGAVVLAETDVTLPGVLPLVFERDHSSFTRNGRWFGQSWHSTLDQRLRVTADRIYGKFDGEALKWAPPVGAGDPAVLPVTGPVRPLARNADGSYVVSDPQRGLTWKFDHRPGHEDGVLPLVSVTDRAGHEITFEHDDAGRPAAIVHSGGYRVLVTVTGEHVTAFAVAGRDGADDILLRRYEYDDAGNLSAVFDASGQARRFTYDSERRVTGWTDRTGRAYQYAFDAEGRCVRVESAGGGVFGTFSHEPGRTRWTTVDGAVSIWALTEAGRIAEVTDPIGKIARTEHDERGRVTLRADFLGKVTRYAYDERGNLVSVIDPAERETRVEVDEANLPVRITGPDGNVWLQAFDKTGNRTELTAPDGSVRKNGYDSSGHLAEVVTPDGAVTAVECDAAGLPVAVTKPTGETLRYERDGLGRVVRVTSSAGGTTTYAWTADGLPVSRTRPDGSAEAWAWDGEANLVRRTSATGAVTSYAYGPFDQLVSVEWPGGARSELEYDDSRRLVAVTHAGMAWRYEIDSAGRLSAQTDYNGSTTQYWYDAASQLVHRVIPSGHEASFAYSPLNKLSWYHTADGTVATFEHDPMGRLVLAKNDDAELVLVRDALGRVVTDRCHDREVTKTYDAAGRVTSRVTPSGATVAWTYDATGMLASVTAGGRELRFGHDAAGRETRRELPGGTVLTQDWDELGRLVAQGLTSASGQQLQRRAYTYGPEGTVTAVADLLTGDRTYRFDAAGRVTAVIGEGWAEEYGYDTAGNLVHAGWPGAETSAQGPRELNGTLTTQAGKVRYSYDASGRVVSRTGEEDAWRYSWDAESRLYSATLPDGSKWYYTYDPIGRRTGKRHQSADGEVLRETRYAWDGEVLVEQEDVVGDRRTVTTWAHRDGVPVAQVTQTGSAAPEFLALVPDVTGTPAELVSADGAVAGYQQRTWLGRSTWLRDRATTPLRRPGQYRDEETGLHHDGIRYYDPETGTYLGPDPLGQTPAPNPHTDAPAPATADPLGLPEPSAAWTRAVDEWIGSVLHLPFRVGVDAVDTRLLADGAEGPVVPAPVRARGDR